MSAPSGATSPSRGCRWRSSPGTTTTCSSPSATTPPSACSGSHRPTSPDSGVTDLLTAPELRNAARQIARGRSSGWSGPIGVAGQPRTRLDGTLSLIEELEDGATFSLHLVDVTEPHEMQERLQAERNYTRAVIDIASSMIVLTTSDGTVIAANPATTAADRLHRGRAHRPADLGASDRGPSSRPASPSCSAGPSQLPRHGRGAAPDQGRPPARGRSSPATSTGPAPMRR